SASIPISFAGWGVRELSALYAFGAIGVPPESALVVSIAIGLLSLGTLITLAVITQHGGVARPRASDDVINVEPSFAPPPANLGALSSTIQEPLYTLIPIAAVFLVFFQIRLPVGDGILLVNLADPVVVAGAFLFSLFWFQQRASGLAFWRLKYFEFWLAGTTAVICLGFAIGYARYGLIDWALYNRLIGWFVLLFYFATGALLVAATGRRGLALLVQVMVLTIIVIAAVDLMIIVLTWFGLPFRHLLFSRQLVGLAQNPNAFAFQIAMVMAVLAALANERGLLRLILSPALRLTAMSVLTVATIYTQSRTGFVTVASVLLLAGLMGWMSRRHLLVLGTVAGLAVALPILLDVAIRALEFGSGLKGADIPLEVHDASADTERLYSI
ncbi:MAG: hypothetical protein AAFQ99_12230, partial [Pseudomonadota bacterium]